MNNSILTAATLRKNYKVGVFGATVVVTDDHHKTRRFQFGSSEDAFAAATKLVSGKSSFFKVADVTAMEKQAARSRIKAKTRAELIAAGIIAA